MFFVGLIQVEGGGAYEFGIMGLACKREILQVGDPVTFQADVEGRATNIVPIRKKRRAVVDAIKGDPYIWSVVCSIWILLRYPMYTHQKVARDQTCFFSYRKSDFLIIFFNAVGFFWSIL